MPGPGVPEAAVTEVPRIRNYLAGEGRVQDGFGPPGSDAALASIVAGTSPFSKYLPGPQRHPSSGRSPRPVLRVVLGDAADVST